MTTPYDDGFTFGRDIKAMREAGDQEFDPRWAIAEEARDRSREDFKEYMRGVNDGCQ